MESEVRAHSSLTHPGPPTGYRSHNVIDIGDVPRSHGIDKFRPDPSAGTQKLVALPFLVFNPSELPQREFILGDHLIRGCVTGLVAPGGVGKTSLMVLEAVALATGRGDICGLELPERSRVWVYSLEEELAGLLAQIAAICQHWSIELSDLVGWLFLNSGFDLKLVIAGPHNRGYAIHCPVSDAVTEQINANNIDVMFVDPFVCCHECPENDNSVIDKVVREWAQIAHQCNCSVQLTHHTRKSNGNSIDADAIRGGSAFKDAVRCVRVLTECSSADETGDADPASCFKSQIVKQNYSMASDVPVYERTSVKIANSAEIICVVPVRATQPVKFTADQIRKILTEVDRPNSKNRENKQSPDWVGYIVAEVMEFDLETDRAKIISALSRLIELGHLVNSKKQDKGRKLRPVLIAGRTLDA
jgi:hypothetical protein